MCSDTKLDAALLNPQVRRSRAQDLFPYAGPKSSRKWLLYLPFEKSAPTVNFKKSPLCFGRSNFALPRIRWSKALFLNLRKLENSQRLTFSLSPSDFSLSQFRELQCRATRPLDFRNPIYRTFDVLARLTRQRPLTPSELRTSRYRES
jgi:hypothetical protein